MPCGVQGHIKENQALGLRGLTVLLGVSAPRGS